MTDASISKLSEGLTIYASEGATINITIDWGGGLKASDAVKQDMPHCQRERLFGQWLAAEVDASNPAAVERSTSLYRAYQLFCDRRGVPACCTMSQTRFGRELGARGFDKRKNGSGRVERTGLSLKIEHASQTQGVAVGSNIGSAEPCLPLQAGG